VAGLASLDAVYIALVFIVPGFVIRAVRAQFIIEQDRTQADQVLRFFTYGAINFALSGWVIYLTIAYSADAAFRAMAWTIVLLIAPCLIGITSAYCSQREVMTGLYRIMGLKPIHVVPWSWDYKFASIKQSWLLVTLKSGDRFSGFWAGDSFASTDPKERDLLIEKVYEVPEQGPWTATDRSVLIAAGEIRTIEFIPYKESKDGQGT
jgi:hypothetical protein